MAGTFPVGVSEPCGPFASAVASTMMWGERLVGTRFPSPYAHHGGGPSWTLGTKVAVVAFPGRRVEIDADTVFQVYGCRLVPLAVYPFLHRGVPAVLHVLETRPR